MIGLDEKLKIEYKKLGTCRIHVSPDVTLLHSTLGAIYSKQQNLVDIVEYGWMRAPSVASQGCA